MPDQPVAEHRPRVARDELDEVLLDFDRVGVFGESQAEGKPADMGVHNDAGVYAVSVAENDVCGLASDAWQGGQLLKGFRHLAAMLGDDGGGAGYEVFCLATEKPGGADDGFDVSLGSTGQGGRVGVGGKERRGDHIYALVSALRRKDGGNQQLVGGSVVQFAVRVGVGGRERFNEQGGASRALCHLDAGAREAALVAASVA